MDGKPKVLVSVPNMGWMHVTVFGVLANILKDDRIDGEIICPQHVPYENNMNKIVKRMLEGDYDFWINIDNDNAPIRTPVDLIELDLDVVGLPTPIWQPNKIPPWFYSAVDQVGTHVFQPHLDMNGLQRVDAVGSGCMVVARRVLEAVKAPFMRIWNDEGIVVCGCDYAFCERVRDAGFHVHAHYGYPCRHVKEVELGHTIEVLQRVFTEHGSTLIRPNYKGGPLRCDQSLSRPTLDDADSMEPATEVASA